jgi:hypothetical protein
MNKSIIYASVIALLVSIFYAGYYLGKQDSEVKMKSNDLVIANCVDISPPDNRTFGSTTLGIINCASQYKKCQTACLAQ